MLENGGEAFTHQSRRPKTTRILNRGHKNSRTSFLNRSSWLVVFRVTRKTGKKPVPGSFLGFFRITRNRNRIQNSFRITRIRKKTETLFSGLPKSGKKPEYFFSDYPNPKKNRNTFFRITRIRKKPETIGSGLTESEKKPKLLWTSFDLKFFWILTIFWPFFYVFCPLIR